MFPGFGDFHVSWLGSFLFGMSFVVTPDWTALISFPFLVEGYWVMRMGRGESRAAQVSMRPPRVALDSLRDNRKQYEMARDTGK